MFDDFYITFYNLVFTAWPVVVRAILDQDVYYKKWTKHETLLRTKQKELFTLDVVKKFYPSLYYVGQKNTIFNYYNFIQWVLVGILTGVFCFFFSKYCTFSLITNINAYNENLWFFSIILFTGIIFIVDAKLIMNTKSFTWISIISVLLLSLGTYLAYFFIADNVSVFYVYKTVYQLLISPHFYLIVFLVLCLSIIYDIGVICFIRETETPTYMLFRSILHNKKLSKDERYKVFECISKKDIKVEHDLHI